MDLAREYVLLGLRFDRLSTGFVDAYTGDPALRRQVEDEPRPLPVALAAQARSLLAELPSSGLAEDRVALLHSQLTALECNARRLAGEPVGFVDEVKAYFGVDIALGDESDYAAAHEELAELLPGAGPLAERCAAYRTGDECPPDRLDGLVRDLSSALRDVVRTGYGLPEGETVEYQIVTDEPWSGFNYYLGGFRSRVAINADLPHRLSQLPHLVAHEAYPGHHTEHCRKERGLVGAGGRLEHTVFLVNTPECLIAEGLADLGVPASIGAGWGPWAGEIYADLKLGFDGELAERVSAATQRLERCRSRGPGSRCGSCPIRSGARTPPRTWRATGCSRPGWTPGPRGSRSVSGSYGCWTSRSRPGGSPRNWRSERWSASCSSRTRRRWPAGWSS